MFCDARQLPNFFKRPGRSGRSPALRIPTFDGCQVSQRRAVSAFRTIDQQLRDAGWEADTRAPRHANGAPTKGRNLAIAEWLTASGPADYALFVGLTLVGVVEAKRKRKNVSAAIDQAERYSSGVGASEDFSFAGGAPWGDHKVPFVFAANGRSPVAFC